jgi:HD-GYP domain-containing protein (c-di-GMP phosphodiesterase class II)
MEACPELLVNLWIGFLKTHFPPISSHLEQVAEISCQFAQFIGFEDEELVQIRRGALLHDMGKLLVPREILNKPGPLNAQEWEIIKTHPDAGYTTLAPLKCLRPVLDIPFAHHERWDGGGYPQGLKGEEIPLRVRMFSIVDVWDALTSDRPYRPAYSHDIAKQFLAAEAGGMFDPHLVQLFFRFIQTPPLFSLAPFLRHDIYLD